MEWYEILYTLAFVFGALSILLLFVESLTTFCAAAAVALAALVPAIILQNKWSENVRGIEFVAIFDGSYKNGDFSFGRCSYKYPIKVTVSNRTNSDFRKIKFDLALLDSKRNNFSFKSKNFSYVEEIILSAGETNVFLDCYRILGDYNNDGIIVSILEVISTHPNEQRWEVPHFKILKY